jgi:uncharacterized lipoprotein YbaY
MIVVAGDIILRRVVALANDATVIIRYEDTSRIGDASPRIIAEKVMTGIAIDPAQSHAIPFSIEIPESEISPAHNLSVHIDISGTGRIDIGDYITTEAISLSAPTSSLHVVVSPVQ